MVVDHMDERGVDFRPPSPRRILFRFVLLNRFLCIIHYDFMNDGFSCGAKR